MTERAIAFLHSPFVGPSSWAGVANACRAMGFTVVLPSLSSIESLSYGAVGRVVADAVSDFEDIVLVAHSGAGSVVDAVAEVCAPRISIAFFVDAILPHPARSWLSTLPPTLAERLRAQVHNGRLPTWEKWFPAGIIEEMVVDARAREAFIAELPHVPLSFANEVAPTQSSRRPHECAYLRLSPGYEVEACQAEALGWPTMRRNLHHLAILTEVDGVTESLRQMIGMPGVARQPSRS